MQKPLLVLLAIACMTSGGCNKDKIGGTNFDQPTWEKQIKARDLSVKQFTQLYALRVAAEFKGAQVRIAGDRELNIKLSDGTQLRAFLDNAWNEAAKTPESRPEIVRRYLSALTGAIPGKSPLNGLPDTNRIVAVIRDFRFAKELESRGSNNTNAIVSESLAADLMVMYAVDGDGLIHYLTEGDRQQLGLSLPDLRNLAMANLKRLLPDVRRSGITQAYMITADGNYESSLLLADKLWEDQLKSVEGDLVAAVPARDMLIFTGTNSKEGINALRRICAKVEKEGNHLISSTLVVRRNGQWEKFSD